MKEVSVKSLILSLISFIVVAVAITAVLIAVDKNKDSSFTNYDSGEKNVKKEKIIGTKENQKYNQNDLEILREYVTYEDLEYQTIRISGLKNKEIENKINKELEEVEDDFRKKVVASPGENGNMYISSDVTANYSNVLSITFYGSKSDSNYRNQLNIHKFLNYDLTTGNHIKLEELFLPGTDIDLYAQNYIYKQKLHEKFSEKNIFFDPKYWQSGELQYVLDEIDEDDFIKEYIKYKNADKEFYLSYDGVYIKYSEDVNFGSVYIEFSNCLDDVVIYNKFVTKESIFEKDDIGLKDLYVCSSVVNYSGKSTFIIKDVLPNFRIDARINILCSNGFENMEVYKNALTQINEDVNKRKEEYTKLANENKDQYYFVGILYYINDFDPNFYVSTYNASMERSHDKFLVVKQERIYNVSMDDFSKWFEDRLIENCRRDNYTMDYQIYINLSNTEKEKCNIKEDESGIVYNVNTGETTSDLDEIFVDGVDYVSAISERLEKNFNISKEKAEEMIKNHEYIISPYTITFKSGDTEFPVDYMAFKSGDFK